MKKTAIMFIIACFIAYAIDWLVRKTKTTIQRLRMRRQMTEWLAYVSTDEYQEQVDEFAREVIDSLNL